jgi:hypothetical protein
MWLHSSLAMKPVLKKGNPEERFLPDYLLYDAVTINCSRDSA